MFVLIKESMLLYNIMPFSDLEAFNKCTPLK